MVQQVQVEVSRNTEDVVDPELMDTFPQKSAKRDGRHVGAEVEVGLDGS